MEAILSIISIKVLFGAGLIVAHLFGILLSIDSVLRTQSAQGAIAWAISLNTLPYIAVPLYFVFGRNKFHGYIKARYSKNVELTHITKRLLGNSRERNTIFKVNKSRDNVMAYLAGMPFTSGNKAELLINGDETFNSIFEAIDAAKRYILVQFFIIEDDYLGRRLKAKLLKKSKEGVRIYFIYDEIGCHNLSNKYLSEIKKSNIHVTPFNTTRGKNNRFQLNFRNHRKSVVVDGKIAFIGGHNVGDKYLGLNPKIGDWRDTHVKVEGPAVQSIQICFTEDWYWATSKIPNLNWDPIPVRGSDLKVLVAGSGPADNFETCNLMFMNAINNAKHRIWITSPYFVPDKPILTSLQLASLRGVDVRIMLPEKPDQILAHLSAFSYIKETEKFGVKFYRYQPGFLHQKVMLVDDDLATIGTANFDNRSFRLNFEITLLFLSRSFVSKIEKMLENDFFNCRQITSADFDNKPIWHKFAIRFARLLAPVQ